MDTMAGHPTLLAGFEDAVSSARINTDWEQSAVLRLNGTVASGCPGRSVSVPALAQLNTALDAMAANERWLDAIADALEAADNSGEDGVVTLTESEMDLALEAAGVPTDAPEATEFSETTRLVVAPTSGLIDDPINAANGNMIHPEHDLAFPAIAASLNVSRTWNSLLADRPGAFGHGWSSVYDTVLDIAPGEVTAHLSDGNAVGFTRSRDGWQAPSVGRLTLVETDEGWTLDTDEIRRFDFDRFGALTGWQVGVARVTVEHDHALRIVTVTESVTGRSLSIDWTTVAGGTDITTDVIDSITASDGRSLRYQRAGDGTLLGAVSHSGSVTYRWNAELLEAVIDPDGVELFVNSYDEDRRVVSQLSPFGRTSSYTYRDDGMTVITDADGVTQAMKHDRFGDMTDVIDLDGSRMHLDYDHQHRAVKIVERDGATWTYRYDGDDQIERVDPDGLRLTQAWDEQHRVVEATDRAGFTTRMEYDTDHVAPSRVIQPDGGIIHQQLDGRGLPTEITDADGVVNRFTWDSDGQLVATHDAFGAVTEFEYDPYGHLRGITPATGNPTVMELAPGGRVLRTTCGDATWEYDYTAAGRIRGGVEPGDLAWSATFGAHGAVASVSDATGATVGFDYDAVGNLTTTTAPDGEVYRNIFDDVGRPTASVDPTGATVAQAHDRRGRVVEVTDPLGNTWRRDVDIMSRTSASTAPDGTVTQWAYDAVGNAVAITGPDGRVWRREFDHGSRPVAVIDPTGGRATIEYSPAGRVTARTSPAGLIERFEYDIAGRLSGIVGIDGVRREARRDDRGRIESMVELDASGTPSNTVEYRWDDGYRLLGVTRTNDDDSADGSTRGVVRDAGGRVTEAVDAAGVRTRYDWDDRGLMASATDPSGASTTYDYDVRGRLTGVTTPGERTHSIAYGDDGRAASITDPAGVVTSMLRNASGAVTGQRVGAGSDDEIGWTRTLDAMGRETSRTSLDGSIASSYDYDTAGRLLTAGTSDDDVTIGFLFDDNDLLESVDGPDGMRLIERDADGWVTATVDPDGTRTEFRRDAAGRIVGAAPGTAHDQDIDPDERDRAGRLTIGRDGTVFRYDDAARIAEIAPVHGAPRTFEYDDDGLLTSETGPTGRRDFRYDDAGRVVGVVTAAGTTTIGYDATGRRVSELHPDDSTTTYVWDGVGRLARTQRTHSDGSIAWSGRGRLRRHGPPCVRQRRTGRTPRPDRPRRRPTVRSRWDTRIRGRRSRQRVRHRIPSARPRHAPVPVLGPAPPGPRIQRRQLRLHLLLARPDQLDRPHRDAPHLTRGLRGLPGTERQRHLRQSLGRHPRRSVGHPGRRRTHRRSERDRRTGRHSHRNRPRLECRSRPRHRHLQPDDRRPRRSHGVHTGRHLRCQRCRVRRRIRCR